MVGDQNCLVSQSNSGFNLLQFDSFWCSGDWLNVAARIVCHLYGRPNNCSFHYFFAKSKQSFIRKLLYFRNLLLLQMLLLQMLLLQMLGRPRPGSSRVCLALLSSPSLGEAAGESPSAAVTLFRHSDLRTNGLTIRTRLLRSKIMPTMSESIQQLALLLVSNHKTDNTPSGRIVGPAPRSGNNARDNKAAATRNFLAPRSNKNECSILFAVKGNFIFQLHLIIFILIS